MKKILHFTTLLLLIVNTAFGSDSRIVSDSHSTSYSDNEAGLKILYASEDVKLYPNPAEQSLFIDMEGFELEINRDVQISIRNILGNSMNFDVSQVDYNTIEVSVGHFPKGYYLVSIYCNSCKDNGRSYEKTYKFLKV